MAKVVHCDADCTGNQVYGFGSGKRGQLGVSNDRVKSVNVPKVVSGFEGVEIAGIAANGDHSAAVSGKSTAFPLHDMCGFCFSVKIVSLKMAFIFSFYLVLSYIICQNFEFET